MHPAALLLLTIVPSLTLTWALTPQYFLDHWDAPKLFEGRHLLASAAAIAVAAIAVHVGRGLVGSSGRERAALRLTARQLGLLERAGRWLFWASVLGYAAWAVFAIARGLRGGDVVDVLGGTPDSLSAIKRSYLAPVAGVTTLTQLGPIAVTCLTIVKRLDPAARVWTPLLVLGALALGRTVLYAERLALLEVVIPAAVVWLALAPRDSWRRTPARRAAIGLIPVWAPIALILFFGSFEYLRSWSSHYGLKEGGSYVSFTLDRLAAYYATANNNSVLLLDSDARLHRVPRYTAEWLWSFPGVADAGLYDRLAGVDVTAAWSDALAARANPEFNNTGGVLVPAFDFGWVGCLVFWALAGALLGVVYQGFRNGALTAWLVYPVLFIGLLELPRLLYWPQGRAFPSIAAALVVGIVATNISNRR
jgi:hypothetical protein